MVPRANVCNLSQEYAQVAENIDLTQPGWVPWKQPEKLIEFEHSIASAHVHSCCWAGVPVKDAHYLTSTGCGNKTYLSAEHEYPVVTEDFCDPEWTRLGFPVPPKPDVCVLDSSEPCDMLTEQRTYKLVYCSECEQGPGSEPSDPVVVNDKRSVAVSIPTDIDPLWGVTHIKVYRLASTWDIEKGFVAFDGDFNPGFADIGTESDYFYAGKVPVGTPEFCDDVTECLGHSLRTDDFYPPRKGLRIVGETALQSLVGFEGKNLWFSERNAYWAYPLRARHNFPEEIQCVAVCQDTVIVITRSRSYTVEDTVDCRDSTCRPVRESKESFEYCGTGSCVVVANGLLYTTQEGLAYSTTDGRTSLITTSLFGKHDWMCADPSHMQLGKGCDHLLLSTSQGTYAIPLRFDEQGQLPDNVSTLSFSPDKWVTDEHEHLYFIIGNAAYSFNTGADYMDMHWRQAEQTPGIKTRASSLKADYENKQLREGNAISLYRNGVSRVHTRAANRAKRFRGVLSDCYAIEVRGNKPMCGLHYGVGLADLTLTQ